MTGFCHCRLYQLDDQREEAGRVAAIRAAMEASGVSGRRTVILLRDHALTPTILGIVYSLAQHGQSRRPVHDTHFSLVLCVNIIWLCTVELMM